MIEEYARAMEDWSVGSVSVDTVTPEQGTDIDYSVGCCSMPKIIAPEQEMAIWAVSNTDGCILANADYFYTKEEVDHLIDEASGMTPEEVQVMINRSIKNKADKEQVNELAQQVSANTQSILNTYTKQETNSLLDQYLTKLQANTMFANYTKVEDTTLILNSENIT